MNTIYRWSSDGRHREKEDDDIIGRTLCDGLGAPAPPRATGDERQFQHGHDSRRSVPDRYKNSCERKVPIIITRKHFQIFLSGLAGGAYPLISTIYITECVELKARGSFGMFMSIMITVGNLFVNCVGNFVGWVPMTGILIAFPSKEGISFFLGTV